MDGNENLTGNVEVSTNIDGMDHVPVLDVATEEQSVIAADVRVNGVQRPVAYDETNGMAEDEPDTGKFNLTAYVDHESESSELDPTYFSDDDTSSLAGSFEEFGKDENDEDSYPSDQPTVNHTREEKMRRQAIRRHLDKLGDLVVEREYLVQKSRAELASCREKGEILEKELENVQEMIEEADTSGARSSYFRLKSQYEKLCSELKIEKDLEKVILQKVDDAEFSLAQAYIEHGKFLPLDEELAKEEKIIERQKAEKAAVRVKKENAAAIAAERRKRLREKENLTALRERERKHRQSLSAARKNRDIAMKYLKETMSRVRQKESEEEEKNRSELNNRMQALLSLRKNIEGNKENLKALQVKSAQKQQEDAKQEEDEREHLLAQGLNPDEILTRRKRLRQFDREKELFERKQREKEIEIVDKLLYEEKQMKKKHQQQPQLWQDRQRERSKRMTRRKPKPKFLRSSGSESMEYSADVEDTGGRLSQYSRLSKLSSDDDDFSPYGATSRDEAKTGESEEEVVVVPEFKGLWEADGAEDEEVKEKNWKSTTHEYSKLEKEMMQHALGKQKENIVQKQVAAGREFKGSPFTSKPEIIIFKDFDVDRVYKKKVLLTNVSYTQNFCKYTGMTNSLKDFIEIQFSPPGPLSAGLTCDFFIVFKPLINEDLEGTIDFLAQSGPFFVPIKCLKKRCEVKVDTEEIDFGSLVIGETKKKSILLTNSGAMGCNFTFKKLQDGTNHSLHDETLSVGGLSTYDENTPLPGTAGNETITDEEIMGLDEKNTEVEAAEDKVVESQKLAVEDMSASIDESGNEEKSALASGRKTAESGFGSLHAVKVLSTHLGSFSSVKLYVLFCPTFPMQEEAQFTIRFDDPNVPQINLCAKGKAIDVPVRIKREVVDLKVCLFDRLYQDSLIIHNRATSAFRLRFEVPKELKNHMELLPRTAYVQAESDFSAQLKFLPRHTLSEDAGDFFDSSSGALHVPLTIRVADQTKPVPFTVKATVSSSDFEFDVSSVDFGHCTVYESVQQIVRLTNRSVLPQEYGFVRTPETVDIQPNDGFGTLLPEETIDIFVIFSPTKAREYTLELTCKSGIGREFKIKAKGVGVLPPLELSSSVIRFAPTAVGDTSSFSLYVVNSHLSTNQFTHPVPRIGLGPIFPVGPTSFEFLVPGDCNVSISPSVGTVEPGERFLVHVTFSPKLKDADIKREMLKIKQSSEEAELKSTEVVAPEQKGRVKTKKGNPKSPATTPTNEKKARESAKESDNESRSGKDIYALAYLSLLKSFQRTFQRIKLPCFIASGECGDLNSMEYDPRNTLYLDLHCPTVKPSIVLLSNNGKPLIDFGNVVNGDRKVMKIFLQNISSDTITLTSTALDPFGPFEIRSSFHPMPPGESQYLSLAFTPKEPEDFFETLDLNGGTSVLRLRLKGKGSNVAVELSIKDGKFDIGDALVADLTAKTFEVTNTSELPICVKVALWGLSHDKHNKTQVLANKIEDGSLPLSKYQIGPNNMNGSNPFECTPQQWKLNPGDKKEFKITFSPDHPHEYFTDQMVVSVNERVVHHAMLLARAWPNIVFTHGWDRLHPVEAFLGYSYVPDDEEETHEVIEKLLTFYTSPNENGYDTVLRRVVLGCIRSSTQTKKSCDFYFDGYKEAGEKGFTVEPMKGGVDIGLQRDLEFKWNPLISSDPTKPVNATIQLFAKGDVTLHYNIHLLGIFTNNFKDDKLA